MKETWKWICFWRKCGYGINETAPSHHGNHPPRKEKKGKETRWEDIWNETGKGQFQQQNFQPLQRWNGHKWNRCKDQIHAMNRQMKWKATVVREWMRISWALKGRNEHTLTFRRSFCLVNDMRNETWNSLRKCGSIRKKRTTHKSVRPEFELVLFVRTCSCWNMETQKERVHQRTLFIGMDASILVRTWTPLHASLITTGTKCFACECMIPLIAFHHCHRIDDLLHAACEVNMNVGYGGSIRWSSRWHIKEDFYELMSMNVSMIEASWIGRKVPREVRHFMQNENDRVGRNQFISSQNSKNENNGNNPS